MLFVGLFQGIKFLKCIKAIIFSDGSEDVSGYHYNIAFIQSYGGSMQKVRFLDLIVLDQDESATGQLNKLLHALGEKRGRPIEQQDDLIPFLKKNLVALVCIFRWFPP